MFLVEFKDGGEPRRHAGGHGAGRLWPRLQTPPADRSTATWAKSAKLTFKPKEGMKVKRFKVDKKSLKGDQTRAATPALARR